MSHDYSYEVIRGDESGQADIVNNEKSATHPDQLIGSKRKSIYRSMYFFITGISLTLSFILGSVFHPLSISRLGNEALVRNLSDPNAFIPPLPVETKKFEFDWKFANDPSQNVTSAWESLIPKGQGLLRLPLEHEYNSNVFNIGAYHTLHCLFTLRESFFFFHDMAFKSIKVEGPDTAFMLKHGRHCIEYIRQALMCNPDVNLEPVEGETGNLKQWGIRRQCKSFDALSEWAYELRASDNEGITAKGM
ncbi:hypothetical protein GGR53DRAFT_523746 [Hypoxylon sp. FL1150]|nr:hypothetical protein GGR53DRAFT_523746 [Hypoxylon sp. FL1150]